MYTVTVNKNLGENSIKEGESYELLSTKLSYLDPEERENLLSSSKKILENCIPPIIQDKQHKFNDTTGLVFGYVQSGKTLSFTTVMALAHDNDYRVAILIAGRTNLLLSQNTERLTEDIGDNRNISVTTNESDPDFVRKIDKSLKNSKGRLLIITILKHQDHINNLAQLFKDTRLKDSLNDRSIIIFDDESDQASLNTMASKNSKKATDESSAIFSSIKNLRSSIANHSYIQYTATPQANLLIDYIDLLSPQWHVLLDPGKSYTGGLTFFKEPLTKKLTYNIPEKERFHFKENKLTVPPQGLIDAIYKFILSSIFLSYDDFDMISERKKTKLNKTSMMIHPCFRKDSIETFFNWTESILDGLQQSIEANNLSFLNGKLEKYLLEYGILFNTKPELNKVAEIINNDFLGNYKVHQVVGGMEKKAFPWSFADHHILIGGQLLDRGFTVKNLIITYMPRDTKGKNNADTIEQRCRFFGYKKDYIDFCEVYLPKGLKSDYVSYVDHEINLRKILSTVELSEFKKAGSPMLSAAGINLTNNNRIGSALRSDQLKGFQYFEPPLNIDKNNEIVNDFINDIPHQLWDDLMPNLPKDQTENTKHKIVKVELVKIIELITKIDIGNAYEAIKLSNFERYIFNLIENHKQEFAWVIQIATDRKDGRPRTVSFDRDEKYKNPYKISALASNYPSYFGDSKLLLHTNSGGEKFGYNNEVILQIHKITAGENTTEPSIKGKCFYTLAFNFSEKFNQIYVTKILN
ncbi:Z1 domain-containing protein [Flavobacterium bizetiae]|uniref:Z1 domain-containing protein n=1 Tax=Flavobacterium bizetiae TaxID=2704140 RepID=UPI003756AEB6